MPDEPNNAPPAEGTAPAPAAQTATTTAQPEAFSADDVRRILEADRAERQPVDPVARFKEASTRRAAQTQSGPQPQSASRVESLVEQLVALQIAALKPPAPPAPPKQMSAGEKLASVDPDVFLRRGPNAWTQADTATLASDIARAKGISMADATALARRQVVERAQTVAGNVKVHVGAQPGVDPFAALRGGRRE